MTDEEKEKEKSIEKFESHIEKATSNMLYSQDRFDVLIISISSGGLVFSMGFVKDLLSTKQDINFLLLKTSWILFALSIVFNLLSQVSSYYANKYDIDIVKNIIRKKKGKEMKGNQKLLEENQVYVNSITEYLNGISLSFTILAIFILVIFMNINL